MRFFIRKKTLFTLIWVSERERIVKWNRSLPHEFCFVFVLFSPVMIETNIRFVCVCELKFWNVTRNTYIHFYCFCTHTQTWYIRFSLGWNKILFFCLKNRKWNNEKTIGKMKRVFLLFCFYCFFLATDSKCYVFRINKNFFLLILNT